MVLEMTLSYFMQSVSKRLKKASDKAAQETHCKDESSIFFCVCCNDDTECPRRGIIKQLLFYGCRRELCNKFIQYQFVRR